MTVQLAIGLAILLAVFAGVYWLYRRGQDRQALKDTLKALDATEDARRREHEILEAARRVREAPGPTVPDLDELQRGAGGQAPPA